MVTRWNEFQDGNSTHKNLYKKHLPVTGDTKYTLYSIIDRGRASLDELSNKIFLFIFRRGDYRVSSGGPVCGSFD